MRPDPALPLVFTVPDAERAGLTRNQIDTRLRTGRWRRLRRGVFCLSGSWTEGSDEARHLLCAAAVLAARGSSGLVLSHASAAVAHGLPVPRALLDTLTATRRPGAGRRPQRTPGLAVHVASLDAADQQVAGGLAVTAPARTLADCLRGLPAEDAVPIVDAGLRQSRCDQHDIERVLEAQRLWPFAAAANASLALVDARRESALESRSAVVMHRFAIPPPEPQVRILDARRRLVARVDFAWLDFGVVGEADGRVKYAGDAGRVVEAEKDRQAQLEALGLVVVRWGTKHLYGEPPEMVVRLWRALAAGDPTRFRGLAA